MAVEDVNASAKNTLSSSVDWVKSEATDIWQHPKDHIPELLAGSAALATAAFPLGRAGLQMASEFFAARAASAAAADALPSIMPALGDGISSTKALTDATRALDNLGFEINGGDSQLVATTTEDGSHVITTGDGRAIKLRPVDLNSQSTFAHELTVSPQGDSFTARFIQDSEHSNPWSTLNNPVWPYGKTGPMAGVSGAGIHVAPYGRVPMELAYDNKFDFLKLAATTDKKIPISLDSILEGRGMTASEGYSGLPNKISALTITGREAVRRGFGTMELQSLAADVAAPMRGSYPRIAAGNNLKIFYNPNATMRPAFDPDVRIVVPGGGLVGNYS